MPITSFFYKNAEDIPLNQNNGTEFDTLIYVPAGHTIDIDCHACLTSNEDGAFEAKLEIVAIFTPSVTVSQVLKVGSALAGDIYCASLSYKAINDTADEVLSACQMFNRGNTNGTI